MALSSETPYHTLQLVQVKVDGARVLAGHQDLGGRGFDMVTRPVDGLLLFNFNPSEQATKEAGVFALLALLEHMPTNQRVVFVSPGSNKSQEMVQEVVGAYRQHTGIDHKLFIFEKSTDDPSLRAGGFEGHVQDYIPVTSPDETRYLASTSKQEEQINQELDDGAIVVALDDIFSTGATLEAIDNLLEQIGARVSHRFAVGAEVSAELVEIYGDELIWKPRAAVSESKLDVQTAFVLPLFFSDDVAKIIEGD